MSWSMISDPHQAQKFQVTKNKQLQGKELTYRKMNLVLIKLLRKSLISLYLPQLVTQSRFATKY